MRGSCLLFVSFVVLSFMSVCSFIKHGKLKCVGVKLFSSRPGANNLSLDVNLVATQPDLVISHLEARKSSKNLIDDVWKIQALRAERSALIVEGDRAKNTRKTLSQQIGMLMKEKRDEEIAQLKLKVEEASALSEAADNKLNEIDNSMNKLFAVFPNLLDDRWENFELFKRNQLSNAIQSS